MNKNLIIDEITNLHLDTLSNYSEPRLYKSESVLIYEGQIPRASYLLVQGEIHFIKRKKIFKRILPGTLFGVAELMNHTPLKFTVKIQPNSKVCILDKSTIIELLKDLDEAQLPRAFKQFMEEAS